MFEELTFKKEEVLNRLKINREEHLKIVREAQEGYREQYEKLLVKTLDDLRSGKEVPNHVGLTVPSNHVDDYDRAIEMLEMCTEKEIILDENQFQELMRNKWNWMSGFLVSNAGYSATAHNITTTADV